MWLNFRRPSQEYILCRQGTSNSNNEIITQSFRVALTTLSWGMWLLMKYQHPVEEYMLSGLYSQRLWVIGWHPVGPQEIRNFELVKAISMQSSHAIQIIWTGIMRICEGTEIRIVVVRKTQQWVIMLFDSNASFKRSFGSLIFQSDWVRISAD